MAQRMHLPRANATQMESVGQKGMEDYEGYQIRKNPKTERWEVFWKDKKQEVDFASESDAEEGIDDLIPSHRF